MKKTLLALSVLAAASSAQAIELYNQDAVTVNLKGDIEVTYQNSTGSSSMTQQIEDADFGFDVRYAVNDQVSVGGYWEFDGSPSNNSSAANSGDAYVGLYTADFGSVKVGRLCTAIDDIGIGNDKQYGLDSFFDSDTFECQDEALRYDYDNGMFYATVGYVQNKLNGSADAGVSGEDGSYVDGLAGVRVADFDVKAIFADYDSDAREVDNSLFGLEAIYGGIENLNMSVAYYSVSGDNYYEDHDNDAATAEVLVREKRDNDTWALAADYTMGLWVVGAGYSQSEVDVDSFDVSRWFVNGAYKFAPGAEVYAEVAGVDSDEDLNNDNLLAIGVKAAF